MFACEDHAHNSVLALLAAHLVLLFFTWGELRQMILQKDFFGGSGIRTASATASGTGYVRTRRFFSLSIDHKRKGSLTPGGGHSTDTFFIEYDPWCTKEYGRQGPWQNQLQYIP